MSQVARRYARALLMIGHETGSIEKIEDELGNFEKIVRDNPELAEALADPTVLPSSKEKIVGAVVEKLGFSETMRNFLGLLGEKRRLADFLDIREAYRELADAHAGRARATVVSAAALPKEMESSLVDKLSRLTGRKVQVQSKVDPSLLGGVIAEVDGVIYDGSLRTQLRALREQAKGS